MSTSVVGPARVFQVHEIHGDMYVVDHHEFHIHHHHGTNTVHRSPAPTADIECPYPGLAAFAPEQARWFHGRDRLVGQIVERIDTTLDTGRPIMVVAPSGAGKSSLLRAGVLPRISTGSLPVAGSTQWPHLWLTPTAHPVDALAAGLAAVVDVPVESIRTMVDTNPDDVITLLHDRLPGRLIVVVDQFEELFTLCPEPRDQNTFVDLLGLLATRTHDRAPVALVLCGLRSDFYTPCAAFPVLQDGLQYNQIFVGPMSSDELRDAILSPADDAGLRVEPGLVDLLLRDLAPGSSRDGVAGYTPGRLPLLAYALRITWQHRDGAVLTVAGYHESGGIQEAISRNADRVHDELDPSVRDAVRPVLLRLVRVGDSDDGFDDTRRRATPSELALATTDSAAEAVVAAFTQARLFTVEQDTVEITHEALLHAWPRLREWIRDDRAGNRLRQHLEDTADAWKRDRHDNGQLWRGSRLATATAWVSTHPSQLSKAGHAFLAASGRARRRTRLVRRTAITLLMALTIAASGAAAVAAQQRNLAVEREITAEADALRTSNTQATARLDVLAYRRNPTDDLRTRLITDAAMPLSTVLTGHTASVNAVALTRNGQMLASAGDDGTIRLWSTADPAHPIGPPIVVSARVNTVTFSPDGKILVGGSGDGTIRLWDVSDVHHPKQLTSLSMGSDDIVWSVAFSPDGKTLAGGDDDGMVQLWDVTDPGNVSSLGSPLDDNADSMNSVEFSPNGQTLAAGSDDGLVRLWNVADRRLIGKVVAGRRDSIESVAFNPAGTVLAAGGDDNTIRLLNVRNPSHATPLGEPLNGDSDSVESVAFSPDGDTLAGGSDDGEIRLWDVADPTDASPVGQPLTGHTNSVGSVVFSPDGRMLVSGSNDRTIRLWTWRTYLAGHTDSVSSVAFRRDGRILASASQDGTVRLWTAAGPIGSPLPGTGDDVENSVAFSASGRLLAAGGDDHTIRLWNVSDPAKPKLLWRIPTKHRVLSVAFSRTIMASGDSRGAVSLWNVSDPANPKLINELPSGNSFPVTSVAFSPNGDILAVGGDDNDIRLWSVADPAEATQITHPLQGNSDSVDSVAFSPGGTVLASGGDDGRVRLWDVSVPVNARLIGVLSGHTDSVLSVAFSPNGATLASGSDDGTIRLWDVRNPVDAHALGQPLTGHTNGVNEVAFNGTTLISGSDDDTIRFWNIDVNQDIQRICAHTSALTYEQWQADIPDVGYSRRC